MIDPNWKKILIHAYSVWFGAYLPLLWLIGVEVAWMIGIEVSPVLSWVGAFAFASVMPVLRIIKQRSVDP